MKDVPRLLSRSIPILLAVLFFGSCPAFAQIAIDAKVVKNQNSPSSTVTTTAFSTNLTNELLLAFISSDSVSSPNATVSAVSGAGLTWTLVQRTNVQKGTSEIWRAFTFTTLTNVTVSAKLSQSVDSSMTVLSFSGVNTSGTNGSGAIGATGTFNSSSGAPTGSITTQGNASLVLGVGNDWDNAIARMLGSGQTLVNQDLPSVGDTYWVQMQTNPVLTSGTSVTINDTVPTSDGYNLSIVEVLASSGGTNTYTVSGSISPSSAGTGTTVTLTQDNSTVAATSASGGTYGFSNIPAGTYTVTPSNSAYNFSPLTQSVTISTSNATAPVFNATAIVPTPTLNYVSPSSVTAGSSTFTLTLNGSNFVSGDVVLWNGSALNTSFSSATQLSAVVPGSLVANAGSASVSVQPSGGATSNSMSFVINASSGSTVVLGSQTVQSGLDSDSSGQAEAFQSTASASGTINSLFIYVDTSSAATQLVAGLYSDANGRPGTLLAQGSISAPASAAWNSVSVPSVGINAGKRYWIAILGTGGTFRYRDGNGCSSVSSAQNSLTVLPASWTSGATWASCPLSAYAISATAGTGGSPPYTISGTISPLAAVAGTTVALGGAATSSATPDGTGAYSFGGLNNGTFVVTPTNSSYAFTLTNQTITINGANVGNVNFSASSGVPTYSISGSITPGGLGEGSFITLSGTVNSTAFADPTGNYSFSGLPNGSYTITPSSQSASFLPSSQAITVNNASFSGVNFTATATSNVIFFDDFSGSSLSSDWTIISRHGEYAQSETECNIPQQVSVANSLLTIVTAVGPATCGDFNTDGTVRHSPSSWPYITGDIQWTSFNFTYGTVTVRAKFPPQATGTWPTFWMLGSNCQNTNPFTADTGYLTCPSLYSSSYVEIDNTECDLNNWCQLALANYANNGSGGGQFPTCGYPVDTNFHVFTLNWTANQVTVSLDGQPTGCTYSSPTWTIPSTPMFLIIQTQTGGAGGTPDDALLPASFEVDYVKITQP